MGSNQQAILNTVLSTLEALKAENTITIPVDHLTTVTDHIVITTGTSSQHVRAIARNLHEALKKANITPLGFEGEAQAEWILADLGDVVVHIMQPKIREYYQLEKLWSVDNEIDTEAPTQSS